VPAATDLPRAAAFDLDGTLIDTAPDLGAAANAMLDEMGGRQLDARQLRALIGGGITPLVRRALAAGLDVSEPDPAALALALALFTRFYGESLYERSNVYPGVIETLGALGRSGVPMCCVTNKLSRFALPVLEAAGLGDFLDFTVCADDPADRKPSPNLLFQACARLKVEPGDLLYVGDSDADVFAGSAAGCRVVAVDYGYGDRASLERARPDQIVGDIREILESNHG
jgi:phosphoglycolate phosphatase